MQKDSNLWLNVAVNDAIQMKIVQATENLVHNGFDCGRWNVFLELVNERFQIVV